MPGSVTLPRAVTANSRAFAIVPAAGRSRRFGRAKLLTLWRGRPLIAATIDSWQRAGVEAVVVVVHPDDGEIAEATRLLGATVVVPSSAPAEMKDSVQVALDHVQITFAPREADVWLLAPADMPELSSQVVQQLRQAAREHPQRIIVPQHEGRRGHPVLFPFSLAAEVAALGPHEGVNALLQRHEPWELPCGPACLAADIDTPEDLARLHQRS